MEAAFARAGINTAGTIRELGADTAWKRLITAGYPPHFMAYLALNLGLQDRHFAAAEKDEKTALHARFDAINASAAAEPLSGIEAELDKLGVPKSNT